MIRLLGTLNGQLYRVERNYRNAREAHAQRYWFKQKYPKANFHVTTEDITRYDTRSSDEFYTAYENMA